MCGPFAIILVNVQIYEPVQMLYSTLAETNMNLERPKLIYAAWIDSDSDHYSAKLISKGENVHCITIKYT